MGTWKTLGELTYMNVWNHLYDSYNFKASVYPEHWPAISTKLPTLKLNVAHFLGPNYSEENMTKLEELAVKLFHQVTDAGELMYALDWQHDCYTFDPRKPMDRNEFDEWLVPVFPNGDYYIFLTNDYGNMWFGHPWEKTITLVGEKMLRNRKQLLDEFKKIGVSRVKDFRFDDFSY